MHNNISSITLKIYIFIKKTKIFALIHIWSTILTSSLDTMLTLSKTTSPQKLFLSDCITLYLLTFSSLGNNIYSVMQSNGNKFCGDVGLDIFNMAYRHEDSILDQKYVK